MNKKIKISKRKVTSRFGTSIIPFIQSYCGTLSHEALKAEGWENREELEVELKSAWFYAVEIPAFKYKKIDYSVNQVIFISSKVLRKYFPRRTAEKLMKHFITSGLFSLVKAAVFFKNNDPRNRSAEYKLNILIGPMEEVASWYLTSVTQVNVKNVLKVEQQAQRDILKKYPQFRFMKEVMASRVTLNSSLDVLKVHRTQQTLEIMEQSAISPAGRLTSKDLYVDYYEGIETAKDGKMRQTNIPLRCYHYFTSQPKEITKHLLIDSEATVDIDLSQCHVFFSFLATNQDELIKKYHNGEDFYVEAAKDLGLKRDSVKETW